jgi:hypothetical protein
MCSIRKWSLGLSNLGDTLGDNFLTLDFALELSDTAHKPPDIRKLSLGLSNLGDTLGDNFLTFDAGI